MPRNNAVHPLVLLLALAACGPAASEPAASRPNVLILSIESLRWDHLGAAGYHRPVSPNLDQLIERGTYFLNGYSQCSWTRPSVASTFTGAYLTTHQVYGERPSEDATPVLQRDKSELSKIPEQFDTLAERFTRAGYHSVGWSSNTQLWEGLGFAQGFAEYDAKSKDTRIVTKLIELFEQPQKRPFFAFVHFVGPHLPYKPTKEFRHWDEHPDGLPIMLKNFRDIQSGKIVLTEQDMDHNIALYDGAILQVDTQIGEVLEVLEREGLTDETIVVVMSDHGQEFYEHGSISHGHTLYEELIRVPIIMAGPGIPSGKRIDTLAQNIDVLPTLVGLALGETAKHIQGSDLSPLMHDADAGDRPPILSEIRGRHALREGRWKYIANSEEQSHQLYDLESDPLEHNDLAQDPAQQSTLERLSALMADTLAANRELAKAYPTSNTANVPDEVFDRLEALGYVE